jgi:transcriptional regulator with XRE-family HTH domain
MMIPGEISKEGSLFAAALEPLGIYAQGRSRSAALAALAAAVTEQVAEQGPLAGFRVDVTDDGESTIYVVPSDPSRLLALLLRRARGESGMSLADVAKATGAKSRNDWAQYEQGRAAPSIAKLQELLAAVAPDLTVAIIPRTARVLPRWDEEADDAEEIEQLVAAPSSSTAAALRAKVRGKGKARTRKAS